jgi:hypothetical protein
LAVAKLSEPLKKTPDNEFTIRVRLDYWYINKPQQNLFKREVDKCLFINLMKMIYL